MISISSRLIDMTPCVQGSEREPIAKLSRVRQTEARQQKKHKRKASEGKFHVKRQEMDKVEVRDIASFVAFCS
jgi:hypothetical protein